MRLISDNPLAHNHDADEELFELSSRLRVLLDSLRDPKLGTPFSVMVSGSWGMGKTSAMRWMAKELTGEGENLTIDTCWFYPWKYQDREDVWKGLIAEVIVASIKGNGNEDIDARKVIAGVKRFGGFLGAGFVRVLSGLSAKAKFTSGKAKVKNKGVELETPGVEAELEFSVSEAIKGFTEEYASHMTPQKAYFNAFEEELKNWIDQTYGKDRRLIVFIDDLDRCMPDVALQVLEALKLYLNIENLVFVVGVDKQVIDRIVNKQYCEMFGRPIEDEETRQKAAQYLDKMFQVEVDVQPEDHLVNSFRTKLLTKMSWWKQIDVRSRSIFEQVLRDQSGLTPRSVIRTLNAALIKVRDEEDIPGITEAIRGALLELVLRSSPKLEPIQRDALRVEEGREFFTEWRKGVEGKKGESPFLRAPIQRDEKRYGKLKQSEGRPDEEALLDRVRQFVPGLDSEKYEPYWDLLYLKPLGLLSSVVAEEGEPATEVSPLNTEQVSAELRALIATSEGIAEADVTDVLLSTLESLRPGRSTISEELISEIAKISSLKILELGSANIGDQGAKLLSRLTNLTSLSLWSNQIGEKGAESLSRLTNLTDLDLSFNQVNDKGAESLSELANLTRLELGSNQIGEKGAEGLSRLTNLTHLSIWSNLIGDEGAESLSRLTNLKFLNLISNKIGDKGAESLSRLTNLKTLLLFNNHIGDKGAESLSRLTNLNFLNLNSNRIGDKGAESLSKLTNLKYLYLTSNQIGDKGAECLLRLTNLNYLELVSNQITDKGAESLSRLVRLNELYLNQNNLTEAAMKMLKERLPKCKMFFST